MAELPAQVKAWLDQEDAAGVLNHIADWVHGGGNLVPGQEFEVPGWSHRLVVEDVPNPGQIVFGANRHYLRPKEFSVPVTNSRTRTGAAASRGTRATPSRPGCNRGPERSRHERGQRPGYACFTAWADRRWRMTNRPAYEITRMVKPVISATQV